MKKYLFYMMTVAASLGLGGCASNDEVIAETEDVQSEVTHTILARIDNSGNTRVAINGLKLSWEEGDEIGVVYSYGSGPFEIRKYTFAGLTEDGSAAKFTTTDTPTTFDMYLYAYYPYSSGDKLEDEYSGDVNVDFTQKLGPDKVIVPMLSESTNFNMPDELTFKAVGSLLAVKVKDLPAEKFSNAYLRAEKINFGGGTFSKTGYTAKAEMKDLDYDISGLSGSQTFYFPLPAGDIEILQFELEGGISAANVFVFFENFTSTINTKYVKAIELDADGARKTDKITLTNCKLEATNTVATDFNGMNAGFTANFKIPRNQEDNNEEKVTLTISNLPYEAANFIEGDEDFEGAITAKDVEIIDGGGNACQYSFNLPNSNVTLEATNSGTKTGFEVKEVRSFTIGENITTGSTAKVNCQLEKLEIAGLVGSTIQLNDNVSGELIIPDYSGANYKSVTLDVSNGVSIEKITLGTGVRLYIDYGGYNSNCTFETEVNGTKVTFDSMDKSCVVSNGEVDYGKAG